MTKGYQKTIEFPRVNRRVVEANFDGGDIASGCPYQELYFLVAHRLATG